MIEERDLDAAVSAGILDAATREKLVVFSRAHRRGEAGADEEQFRLLTGFNDIFVTIAVGLLLTAVASLGGSISPVFGAIGASAIAWILAEYFTKIKRMALPSIALLLAFVGGVFASTIVLLVSATATEAQSGPTPWAFAVAGAAAAIAAWLHWRRFMVPITVAAGAAALTALVVAGVVMAIGGSEQVNLNGQTMLQTVAICGVGVFSLAMWFDAQDRARVTRLADVAFWLHLLAAPMIIHPVITMTGLTTPGAGPNAAIIVILVYLGLTFLAIAIDRRALLVSALAYVIFAIERLLSSGDQGLGNSGGLTTLVLGVFLVLLSAAWRPIRARVVAMLPASITNRLPKAMA